MDWDITTVYGMPLDRIVAYGCPLEPTLPIYPISPPKEYVSYPVYSVPFCPPPPESNQAMSLLEKCKVRLAEIEAEAAVLKAMIEAAEKASK